MGHSERCKDLTTYWDNDTGTCAPCPNPPIGYEISPNCGYDDDGGFHEPNNTRCKKGTFNNGTRTPCRACTICQPGHEVVCPCNTTSDTKCKETRTRTTEPCVTESTTSPRVSASPSTSPEQQRTFLTTPPTNQIEWATSAASWAVPSSIIIISMMLVFFVYLIYRKRKRAQQNMMTCYKRAADNDRFSQLSSSSGSIDLETVLRPHIMAAPLQTVLDNLDVLEELVMLLDPECQRAKNTKHLASYCSFPSTWITYTYSLKDSKSPLKAVLEGVTAKNPDWTVGHLAKLLRTMERNDALAVLAKLRLNTLSCP